MKKAIEIVQRIERQYIGDDCIQIMFPYSNTLTILNQDGMLYHHKPGSNVYINQYLEDARRIQFPYSNIPSHIERAGIFKKINYTNQLLDYEKPYIRIGDGYCSESFAIRDNNQALLISSIIKPDYHIEYMTYEEFLTFVGKHNSDEQIYYVYLSGGMPAEPERLFPTQEEIYNYVRMQLSKNISDLEDESEDYNSYVGRYLRENPLFLDYAKKNLGNIDFSTLNYNVRMNYSMIIVRINKDNITLQGVGNVFVSQNCCKVVIYDIPVTKYSLEQLKYMSKIKITKEPRIPLRLNPGVTKQDIKDAKQLVKILK